MKRVPLAYLPIAMLIGFLLGLILQTEVTVIEEDAARDRR